VGSPSLPSVSAPVRRGFLLRDVPLVLPPKHTVTTGGVLGLCSFYNPISCILHNVFGVDVEEELAVEDDDRSPKLSASNDELVLLAIRLVCLGLLGYWSLILIRPFLTIVVWSIIIAVALYPIFHWLSAKLYGHHWRRLQLLLSAFS
jgi:hypothetical protein